MTTPDDSDNSRVSVPRPAATVLLLREQEGRVEVLMVRRHANLAFMAGQWVFPGGAMHESDMSNAARTLLDEDTVARVRMLDTHSRPLPSQQAAGLVFAACRETFEETGVLLARHANGESCDAGVVERLQQYRDASNTNAALFIDLLRDENLRLDTSTLIYWSHWITPSSGPKRFDTRFFIVRAPQSQLASADASETVDSCWMTPSDLLVAARDGAMPISHPTQCNLHELQVALLQHHSLQRLFAAEASRVVHPILPKMFRDGDQSVIVMPWDANYESSPGDGVPLSPTDCPALAELPSRFPFREKSRN